MVGIDPGGESLDLPFELGEEVRVGAIEASRRVRRPRRRLPDRDSELVRELAQGHVLVVQRLAAGVELRVPD